VILRRVSRRDASVAELGGAVRDLAILSRTLMARHLGSKLVDAVVALLVGMLRRDPDAPPWMMSIFDRAESTLDVRTAIATALLEYEQKMPGGWASALKDDPACTPEVATLVVRALRT